MDLGLPIWATAYRRAKLQLDPQSIALLLDHELPKLQWHLRLEELLLHLHEALIAIVHREQQMVHLARITSGFGAKGPSDCHTLALTTRK